MRWVGKEIVIEFQSGTVAIEGYFQIERVVSQKEKRKQRGPQRNSTDIFPINVSSPKCFHRKCAGK
jgi:hypothetical protein